MTERESYVAGISTAVGVRSHVLAIHLFNHEATPDADRESRVEHLGDSLRWDGGFRERVIAGRRGGA